MSSVTLDLFLHANTRPPHHFMALGPRSPIPEPRILTHLTRLFTVELLRLRHNPEPWAKVVGGGLIAAQRRGYPDNPPRCNPDPIRAAKADPIRNSGLNASGISAPLFPLLSRPCARLPPSQPSPEPRRETPAPGGRGVRLRSACTTPSPFSKIKKSKTNGIRILVEGC